MVHVLIVASIRLYREGLAMLLSSRDDFTVRGTASHRGAVIECLAAASPDVVLLDLTTQESSAIIRDVRQHAPDVPVVALGVPNIEEEVLSCLEAGVAGFVGRDGSVDELAAVTASAARGELHCTPQLAGSLLRRIAALASSRPQPASEERLTSREWEIVRLIEQNLTNKEIATRLGIEVATVKNHVHNLLEKLKVHRRADVMRRSLRTADRMAPEMIVRDRI